jgi:hypothetical protein
MNPGRVDRHISGNRRSQGQRRSQRTRHGRAPETEMKANECSPSSNLAEVSDWLTKLLLGAGLVQLTHPAAPISHLIDSIAAGPAATTATGTSSAAKVMAGSILFGYAVIGMLDARSRRRRTQRLRRTLARCCAQPPGEAAGVRTKIKLSTHKCLSDCVKKSMV